MMNDNDVCKKKRIWTSLSWHTSGARHFENGNKPCVPIMDHVWSTVCLLLLLWRYNSGRVLAFSTISFHLRRSWTCPAHFISFIFFKSSSHQDSGLPTGLFVNGFNLCIFLTILISGILFMCPNRLNLWALTYFIMYRTTVCGTQNFFANFVSYLKKMVCRRGGYVYTQCHYTK
jgi:hypothetical protein